jgi:hypothetical protein
VVRLPRGFHFPAGGYAPGKLGWSVSARPARRLPLAAYRAVQGIMLQPASSQATVAGASSTGGTTPVLLGSATAASGTTLTVPLSPATIAGQTLVALTGSFQSTANPTVSAVKIGTLADNWAAANTAYSNGTMNAAIWIDPGCAGGQTSAVITFTGGTGTNPEVGAFIFAVPNLAASPLDTAPAGGNGTGTSWSAGSTGPLAQAAEVAFAIIVADELGGAAILPPGAPWVEESPISGGGGLLAMLAGYQVTTTAGSLTYAGTLTSSTIYGTCMITLKAASSAPVAAVPGTAQCQIGPAGLGNIWYPTQVTLSTTTGISTGLDSSVANLYLGPAGTPLTLLGTVFGGNGVVALALPSIQPGQYLIAEWTGANPGDLASMNVQGSMDALA